MQGSPEIAVFPGAGDGLRLLGLGRVPRCRRCPRYHALSRAEASGQGCLVSLPAVPAFCTYQVCAPLAQRYESAAARQPAAALRAGHG